MFPYFKSFAEHFIVDIQQIAEHVFGINDDSFGITEASHYSRPCLFCQPRLKQNTHNVNELNGNGSGSGNGNTLTVLPSTFPSDLAYEMVKLNPAEELKRKIKQHCIKMNHDNNNGKHNNEDENKNKIDISFSGKHLLIVSEEDKIQQRPDYIKELILFLHTLGYETQDTDFFIPYLQDLQPAKTRELKHTPTTLQERQRLEREFKKQKFVILVYSNYNKFTLQNTLLACEPFASQTIVLYVMATPTITPTAMTYSLMLPNNLQVLTPSVISVFFNHIHLVRRFHLIMLKREGRISVQQMDSFCKEEQIKFMIHAKQPNEMERKMNLSFLY